MRLADLSVPMTRPEPSGENDLLRFCRVEDGIGALIDRTAGKLLFVSDSSALQAFTPVTTPRAVFVVLDSADALPLFSMPDGVGGVLAAGGEATLIAARYFAEVRGIPCGLFPSDASLEGAISPMGEVTIGGKRGNFALAPAQIFCDVALLKRSVECAHAKLLLSRLSLLEEQAASVLRGTARSEPFEEAYSLLSSPPKDDESLVRTHARLRELEGRGLYRGEGYELARMIASSGTPHSEWRAYKILSALYTAFFLRGRPRRYAVPDYSARAARAKVPYSTLEIPTREEYARRALALEKMRSAWYAEAKRLLLYEDKYSRIIRAKTSFLQNGVKKMTLEQLPERCPCGLSALIRDFGLLEET